MFPLTDQRVKSYWLMMGEGEEASWKLVVHVPAVPTLNLNPGLLAPAGVKNTSSSLSLDLLTPVDEVTAKMAFTLTW